MCGIAGFSGHDPERIERMTQALKHRGPDNQSTAVLEDASLGNARLAILDPRPDGNQPMWNDTKTVVITYNGEIFNFKTLREEEKFNCRTNTDTEVILKLYDRYGMSFLPRLQGMFAFGLYDTRTKTWHVARSTNGILPLFITYVEGKLHFASEMRALMTVLPAKPKINEQALSQYLRLQYVPGPQTLCEGIESLPPGTLLTWSNGKERRDTFTPRVQSPVIKTKADFMHLFPRMMSEAVKDHLVSDKPVGIFLSGGMDSSIVLHHMNEHAAKPIRTFTVRFETTEEEGSARFNKDADLAALTAKHYGTEHHELLITAAMYRDAYAETAKSLDQPNADSVSVAQFLLAREAKKHVDVILNGGGGDELFGGYPRYRVARVLNTLKLIPGSLRSLAASVTGHPKDVMAMTPGAILAERLLARPTQEIQNVTKGNWLDAAATTSLFAERFAKLRHADPVRNFMEFDRHLWLVDESLRLADATTMGSGVECRVPFLDARIVAASLATPASWHVTMNRTKALLKDTYRNILPEHLFTLDKASFYPPLAKWIRREASPLVDRMLANKHIQERFDVNALRELFEKHKNGEYHLHTLSSLVQLSQWFETVYDV